MATYLDLAQLPKVGDQPLEATSASAYLDPRQMTSTLQLSYGQLSYGDFHQKFLNGIAACDHKSFDNHRGGQVRAQYLWH